MVRADGEPVERLDGAVDAGNTGRSADRLQRPGPPADGAQVRPPLPEPSGGESETPLRERGREGVQPVGRDLLQAGRVHAAPDERVGQHGAFGLPVIGCAVQDVPLGDQHAPSLLDECRMICAVGCRAVMSVNVRMVAMPSQAAMPFTSTWRSAVLAASS